MEEVNKEKQQTQPTEAPVLEDGEMKAEEKNRVDNFEKIIEENLRQINHGEVARGQVLQITPDHVVVDVGYKSEGQISIDEFRNSDGEVTVEVGDPIDVLVEGWEDEHGIMVLSKLKADQMRVWKTIKTVYEQDGVIEGKVVSRIKGGLTVDVGVNAFLPGSQVDIHPVRNLDKFLGNSYKFKILKYDRKRGNIILSRKAIIETERGALRAETIKNLKEGEILEGVIKNITDYGVFIDLGGIDGLLHITDISWGRVSAPSELFALGEKIKVKVLNFDRENERVSLGYKQLKIDPWELAEKNFPVGSRVTGKVVSLTNYGCFVELGEGIEGLIHISEMSWTKKIRHPSQLLAVDDIVETVILDLDIPRKRISLGLKQLQSNPWTVVEKKYPVGTVIEGKIKNITSFGIFIGLDEGIDGLVHISDLSWTQKIKHPAEMYKKDQMVRAVVLNIDKENERFSLGIKQLEPDPWDAISQKYRRGQIVTGVVTNITDFGIFLEIEDGVEGLIHVSEISKEKVDNLKDFTKIGDKLEVLIISIDRVGRKIGLSIRDLKKIEEKKDIQEYNELQEQVSKATLADVMKGERDRDEPASEASAIEQDQSTKADEVSESEEIVQSLTTSAFRAPDFESAPKVADNEKPLKEEAIAEDQSTTTDEVLESGEITPPLAASEIKSPDSEPAQSAIDSEETSEDKEQ